MNKNSVFTMFITAATLLGCNAVTVKPSAPGMGSITIMENQVAFVGLKISNNQVVEVSSLSEGGEINFKLSKTNVGAMLSGKNNLSVSVKYDIYLIDYKGKRHYTSSCPMKAGVGVFESWPHNISKMVIENFRVIQKDGDFSCQ